VRACVRVFVCVCVCVRARAHARVHIECLLPQRMLEMVTTASMKDV